MRVIHLSTFWAIVVDFLAWLIIHLGVVAVMIRIPTGYFDPNQWLYRAREWERAGKIYPTVFGIRKWKPYLPDAAGVLGRFGFQKKQLRGTGPAYWGTFLRETCRAELTHWILILFAPFFFLWNRPGVGLFMVFYALVINVPIIMAQRYNRCRFRSLLERNRFRS